MTRRRALWILGVATLGLFAVLLVLDGQMQDAGRHGIVAFEVAFTSGKAHEILIAWGSRRGTSCGTLSLWLDFLYLIAYGLFLWLAIRALGDAFRSRGMDGWARPAAAISLLPLIGAASDALEDVFLLL